MFCKSRLEADFFSGCLRTPTESQLFFRTPFWASSVSTQKTSERISDTAVEWFLLTMKWLLRSNSSSILGRRRTVLKGGHGSQNFGPEFVPGVWMRDHQKQIFGGLTVENENKLTLN